MGQNGELAGEAFPEAMGSFSEGFYEVPSRSHIALLYSKRKREIIELVLSHTEKGYRKKKINNCKFLQRVQGY